MFTVKYVVVCKNSIIMCLLSFRYKCMYVNSALFVLPLFLAACHHIACVCAHFTSPIPEKLNSYWLHKCEVGNSESTKSTR